jgi:IS605 OrfB family transposase
VYSRKKPTRTFTYQSRLCLDQASSDALQACASLLSKVERDLFADIASGKKPASLKTPYLQQYKISARHFNAIRIQLEGKIASLTERQTSQIHTLEQKIATLKQRLIQLEKQKSRSHTLHQKKRSLFLLQQKLNQLVSDRQTKKLRFCFGSKQLFRAQFHLTANGYQSHQQWQKEWQQARENSFFLVGSKDETSGNQLCIATICENNTLTLRLRLPDRFKEVHGKYLILKNIQFKHGHQQILKALKSCEERKQDPSFGIAISYRFLKDKKGWKVFVSIPMTKANLVTSSQKGMIGIDINSNHLAVAETDHFGNPISKTTMYLNTYGKSRNQAKALIGDACKKLIEKAKNRGKHLVIENLDFQKKKAQLKEQNSPKHARMLSSLAYTQFKQNLISKGWQEGVEVIEVNPAFTSLIGRIKFSKRYGLSLHQAAALTISRRSLQLSERIPSHLETIPDGKDGYVALCLPVRNRSKHVWSSWSILNQELKTVLAAHFRARNRSCSSKPTSGHTPSRILSAKLRHVNRQHNCSVGVLDTSTTVNV